MEHTAWSTFLRKHAFVVLCGNLVLAAGSVEVWQQTRPDMSTPRPSVRSRPLTVAPETAWVGVLTEADATEIVAEEAGRVARVRVQLGDDARAGQVLIELDATELVAGVAQARARVASTLADERAATVLLAQARDQLEALRMIGSFGAAAEVRAAAHRVDEESARLSAAEARRVEAVAVQRQTEERLGRRMVRAPATGHVAELFVRPGEHVDAGTPLVRLVNDAQRLVRFAIPVDKIGSVAVGDAVSVRVASGISFRATVRRLQPDLDPAVYHQIAEAEPEAETRGALVGLPVTVAPAAAAGG